MAKKKTVQNNEMKVFGSQVVGVAGLGMALLAVMGLKSTWALMAIGLGAVSVWSSVRSKEHQFLFLGVAAILIGLVAIWNYASQALAAVY